MLSPRDEAETAEAIRAASGPLCVRGGGTRGLGTASPAEVLSAAGMTGILLYEPGTLTLVARAGTPLSEIEAALAAERQHLAFEPPDLRALLGRDGASTIGGVIAANASGPRRVQAGAARDAAIGVRFVDGTGTVVKNGGRTMKNVTGYDLVKLMAGSRGALGVLTEVSLKVMPVPPAQATLVLPGLGAAGSVAALTAALTSPFDVTGAAFLPGTGALVRIEGLEGSVAYRTGALAARLAPFGEVVAERDPARAGPLWRAVRDVLPFAGRAGDVWRISARPSAVPALISRLGGEALLDWGGGLVWALVPEGADARAALGPFEGHATLLRAAPGTHLRLGTFPPEPAPVAALSSAIARRFDPRGLFSALAA